MDRTSSTVLREGATLRECSNFATMLSGMLEAVVHLDMHPNARGAVAAVAEGMAVQLEERLDRIALEHKRGAA